MAASATFALKSGEWFRRVRFVIFAPDSHAQPCALSGRDSTHRTDRNCGATSQCELRQFGLAELLTGDVVNRIRNLLILKPSIGPRERSALAAAVKMRRLAPCTHHVQALLSLTTRT